MGVRGSSSKRRKSVKKKGSKLLSEARRRKRSNRRSKSKKREYWSDSYSDDSTSLGSPSSSSSENDYRSKRTRARKKHDTRSLRKRAQRFSSISESTDDSAHVRRRKRLRKSNDYDVRKRNSRKKLRRDSSIDSTSSDSRSCSTCPDRTSNRTQESKPERYRGRPREKMKDERDLGNARTDIQQTRNRSPSCSSCSKSNGNFTESDGENLAGRGNVSRLKSIITVLNPAEDREEKMLDKDEEIVYDHDEYQLSRSHDSNDAGSKRALADEVCVSSEKIELEGMTEESILASNAQTTLMENTKVSGGQHVKNCSLSDFFQKEHDCQLTNSVATPDSNALESILRQKALENLRRFRGARVNNEEIVSADLKNASNRKSSECLTGNAESIQSKTQGYGNQLPTTTASCPGNNSPKLMKGETKVLHQPIESKTGSFLRKDFSEKNVRDGKFRDTEPSNAQGSTVRLFATSGSSEENHVDSAAKESLPSQFARKKSATLLAISRYDSLSATTVVKTAAQKPEVAGHNSTSARRVATVKESGSSTPKPYDKMPTIATPEPINEKSTTATRKPSNNMSTTATPKPSNDMSTSATPKPPTVASISLGSNPKEQQNEAEDGSQYQQKTMSVMRGGEMVQVSYKVYIPKNAPALARRKLQR